MREIFAIRLLGYLVLRLGSYFPAERKNSEKHSFFPVVSDYYALDLKVVWKGRNTRERRRGEKENEEFEK